jgi:hypothetical protein
MSSWTSNDQMQRTVKKLVTSARDEQLKDLLNRSKEEIAHSCPDGCAPANGVRHDFSRRAAPRAAAIEPAQNVTARHPDRGWRNLTAAEPEPVAEAGIADWPLAPALEH